MTDEIIWVDRTREITERGVYLRFYRPEKVYESLKRTIPEKRGTVFVEYNLLYDLAQTDMLDGLVIHNADIEQALVDAGWLNQTARGSVYATEKFRELWKETGK